MSFFRLLILLLVTLAGFSTGAVLGHRAKPGLRIDNPRPTPADFAAILFCWSGVILSLISGVAAGRIAAFGAFSGLIIAFAFHRLRKPLPEGTTPRGVPSNQTQRPAPLDQRRRTQKLRDDWKTFASAVGGFQSRVFLIGLYYVALTPFGILVGWLRDPLNLKPSPHDSFWKPKEAAGEGLENARRQF